MAMMELIHASGQISQAGYNLALKHAAGLHILASGHPVPAPSDEFPLTHEAKMFLNSLGNAVKK